HTLYYCHPSPRPPKPTLFPYTTLFRSYVSLNGYVSQSPAPMSEEQEATSADQTEAAYMEVDSNVTEGQQQSPPSARIAVTKLSRSEEHTSELQSRENLVCRLLLEKKKK